MTTEKAKQVDSYDLVGAGLIFVGFVACVLLRGFIGTHRLVGIVFLLWILSGIVVMSIGDRKRAKRRSNPPSSSQ